MTHCSDEAAERQFPGDNGAGSDVTFVRDEVLISQIKKNPSWRGAAREVALGRIASVIMPQGGSQEICRKLIIGHFAGGRW